MKLSVIMVASGSTMMKNEAKELTNVQIISNKAYDLPKFKFIPEIAYKVDPNKELSQIPLNILMINDVRDY